MTVAVTCIVGIFVAVALALVLGRKAQRDAVNLLTTALEKASRGDAQPDRSTVNVADLPNPLQRYLRLALPEMWAPIRLARFRQEGRLRTDAKSARWMKFTASQTVSPAGVGFLWNARVGVAPGVHIQVLDALLDGRGTGRVRLLSAIPIASDGNTPEMNSGALHRFLAEAVWCPTALLPGESLRWSPIDGNRACATLTAGGITVSLEFRFNTMGEIVGIYSPARWGKFGGGCVQKPWEGHFRDYVTIQGMRVPKHGEVGWYDEGVWQQVWEGMMVDATYELGR